MFNDIAHLKTLLTKSANDAAYARSMLADRLNDLRSRFGLNAHGRQEMEEIETLLNS